jgi:DNA-binding SARP family transcriptional activator
MAELLWPDSSPKRAAANLRSALWHCREAAGKTLIECSGPRLRLAAGVHVDLRVALNHARQAASGHVCLVTEPAEAIRELSHPLLSEWMDEWLLLERERWDQKRLHTLETIAQHLISTENYLLALEAALAAVAIEPVRESAHRTVVEVDIAEGNVGCALKHYQRYRGLIQRELGVTPSRQMTRLVQHLASP